MAMVPVKIPLYPNVPQSRGVPPVFRNLTAPVFKTLLLVADARTIYRMFTGPQWGIFNRLGGAVLVPDTVLSVDFRREWRLADYPIERGGFETYNKVVAPYDVRVRMACGGARMPRSAFLTGLDRIAGSMDLFIVATPDTLIPSVNIIHYDYRRERGRGGGMIVAEIWLQQVRNTVRTTFADNESTRGTVQPIPANIAQGRLLGPV